MTTREEAIALAKEAGIISQGYDVVDEDDECYWPKFIHLIDLAKAKENEACAEECERMMMYPGGRQEAPVCDSVWDAAKAIRARVKP